MAEETQRNSTTTAPTQTRRKARPADSSSAKQRPQARQRREPQRRKATNRAAGVEPARRGPNRHKPQPTKRQREKSGVRVPLVPALFVLVTCVVLTAFITRAVVSGTLTSKSTSATTQSAQPSAGTSGTGQADQQAPVEVKDTSTSDSSSGTSSSTNSSTSTSTSTTSSNKNGSNNSTTSSKSSTTGVKDPWVTSGTYTTGDAELDEKVKKFCDSHADSSMDLETALLEVYKGVAWSEYVERPDAQKPAGKNWRIEYAHKYYDHDCSGNCYEFAAFLSYCLQYMGLSDAHAEGVLVEKESGSWGDHGLVYVTNTDGTECLCDTSLGTNGWMLKATAYNVQLQDFENA